MKILATQYSNNIYYKNYSLPSFRGNCTEDRKNTLPIDEIPTDMYFIRMSSYKKNEKWAKSMNDATKFISSMMNGHCEFPIILDYAENLINQIYMQSSRFNMSYGIRRKYHGGCFDILKHAPARGSEYFNTYIDNLTKQTKNSIITPKSNNEYKDAITCSIRFSPHSITVLSGNNHDTPIQTNLELVEKAYKTLKQHENPTKKEIVDTAATMQWLIAQEVPYLRGSDSIANLLTRSLLHSYRLPLSPLKANVSCDFEAFYRNLDDYKEIYPTLFEKNPLL